MWAYGDELPAATRPARSASVRKGGQGWSTEQQLGNARPERWASPSENSSCRWEGLFPPGGDSEVATLSLKGLNWSGPRNLQSSAAEAPFQNYTTLSRNCLGENSNWAAGAREQMGKAGPDRSRGRARKRVLRGWAARFLKISQT